MKNQGKIFEFKAITNRGKFSVVSWAKYFGLYACQNEKGLVDDMYFGPNDSIF